MRKNITTLEYGLGRLFKPDERDKSFLLKSILPEKPKIKHKYWFSEAWWGNQLNTPMCVGYSWAHWLEDGPVPHYGPAPIVPPDQIYHYAQTMDDWEGEEYDGTTVRAGAKYLQKLGYIQSYHWTWDLETMVDALLMQGPVVIGINWYNDMFEINGQGFVRVGGGIAGGHAIIADGVNVNYEKIRLKNSWGRHWGLEGFCFISFKDMERLIDEDGEVCLAIENELPIPMAA